MTTVTLTGDRVRELRTVAGYTQADLAEAAGLSRNTIQLIESGATITPRTMRRLARVLPGLGPATSAIAQVQAELAELRGRVDALAAGTAA